MVRMFVDPGFVAGLDGNWAMKGLEDWTTKTQGDIDKFIQNFSSLVPVRLQRFDPSGIRWGDRIVIVRHPLWDTVDPEGILADWITKAAGDVGEPNIRSVDSFDLFKRPAWVFRELSRDNAVFQLR